MLITRDHSICPIGDDHFPFCHKPSGSLILDFIEAKKPDIVVKLGDTYDMSSFSRFAPRLTLSGREELIMGRQGAEEHWWSIKKLVPHAKCFQLKGNHDIRPILRLWEHNKDIGALVDGVFDKYWHFDGVETIDDPADELIIDDILFTHGHRTKIGDHLKSIQYMHNVVTGHLHRGGTVFERVGALKGMTRWELNAGYWGDPFHKALLYRPMKKYFTWTQGIGWIENRWPQFVPFYTERISLGESEGSKKLSTEEK